MEIKKQEKRRLEPDEGIRPRISRKPKRPKQADGLPGLSFFLRD
jgi:hypothetical protein